MQGRFWPFGWKYAMASASNLWMKICHGLQPLDESMPWLATRGWSIAWPAARKWKYAMANLAAHGWKYALASSP